MATRPALLRSLFPSASGGAEGVTTALRNPLEYLRREGYDPTFLGPISIGFPELPAEWLPDRVPVDDPARPNQQVYDLKYHHFSVVMSASRRMPYFSCVNIDGASSQPVADEGTWRRDPRIDVKYQILTDGIYGRQGDGLFSRGHMTRREDPNWGTPADLVLANQDTFHVTNACPQVQNFNAPIWLGLEDYVKIAVRAEGIKVSVFTGPVFDDVNDPWFHPPGQMPVQVPTSFWKIVVFNNDVTDELTATAYKASQGDLLPSKNQGTPQFMFGEFKEFQMRIADLETETNLKFPGLTERDVLGPLSSGFKLKHADVKSVILSLGN